MEFQKDILKLRDCFTKDCKFCKNTGLLEFKREGKSYPNAPCPCCRYYDLREWLRRWDMDVNIAPWLWQHYSKDMPKVQKQKLHDFRSHTLYAKKDKIPNSFLNKPTDDILQ
jgi:hypothetical protein